MSDTMTASKPAAKAKVETISNRQIAVQLAAKHGLPVMVHTPHRDKRRGTERTIAVMREMRFPPDRCIIDHSTEETTRMILEAGFFCGHTVYPRTKLSPERFANLVDEFGAERMMVNSSADWGSSDALSVPKVTLELRRRGHSEETISKIVWDNPVAIFGKSGKLKLAVSASGAAGDERTPKATPKPEAVKAPETKRSATPAVPR